VQSLESVALQVQYCWNKPGNGHKYNFNCDGHEERVTESPDMCCKVRQCCQLTRKAHTNTQT
jgi:hypothetical protein